MRYDILNVYSVVFIIIGLAFLIFSGGDSVLTHSGLTLAIAAYLYPVVTAISSRLWPPPRVGAAATGHSRKPSDKSSGAALLEGAPEGSRELRRDECTDASLRQERISGGPPDRNGT